MNTDTDTDTDTVFVATSNGPSVAIDRETFETLPAEFLGSWFWNRGRGGIAYASVYRGRTVDRIQAHLYGQRPTKSGHPQCIPLARVLTKAAAGTQVRYRDHDRSNLRQSNLVVSGGGVDRG